MDAISEPAYFIEQTPEFYRRVALKADDEVLVRACLLLAAHEITRMRRERIQLELVAP